MFFFKSSIIIVSYNTSMLCLQAELRKAQTVAIELRKEAQLRKTIADRKTRWLTVWLFCLFSVF